MRTRVLVTGGAGFLGSHVVDHLLEQNYEVAILDSLDPQVHGDDPHRTGRWPDWTIAQVERGVNDLYHADVRDRGDVARALRTFRPHVVVHLAAAVGVGQAEVEIERYVDVNVRGTAVLLEEVLRANDSAAEDAGVRRFVVAGSMSSYGEGAWVCPQHGPQRPTRLAEDLAAGRWSPRCGGPQLVGKTGPACTAELAPLPLEEWVSLRPSGVYAATKRDAEELALLVGRARGLSVAACRFFNIYGPRQALSNPYTGVCAIFAGRVLRGLAPRVYEDGGQARDFVHVSDAARAVEALCGHPDADRAMRRWADPKAQGSFNVGTGQPTTVLRVAELACEVLGPRALTGVDLTHVSLGRDGTLGVGGRVTSSEPALRPEVTGAYRVGDVRACLAASASPAGEISRLRALGWEPKVAAGDGLRELFASWRGEVPTGDPEAAHDQISGAGLLHLPPAAREAVDPIPAADEEGPPNQWR